MISTDPAAGTLVKKGDTVTLKVAAVRRRQVTVPQGLINTDPGQRHRHPARAPA